MIAAHIFLFEKSPKDHINKLWSVIENNKLLIKKQAIAASADDPESFFTIMVKFFPEFSDGTRSPYKLQQMLARFSAVNCISFSEGSIFSYFFPGHSSIIPIDFPAVSSTSLTKYQFPFYSLQELPVPSSSSDLLYHNMFHCH